MKNWVILALISMLFAGLTSVIAKMGLKNVSSDTGLAVRTVSVVIVVAIYAFCFQDAKDFKNLTWNDVLILSISGITAGLSWVFYFRAVKLGEVGQVALIDKGSIVITVLLSLIILHEEFTWKLAVGGALIIAGLLILTLK
jgi:transporter family protein